MTFEITHTLVRGAKIIVTVDAAGDDCLISLSTPYSFGKELENILTDLWLAREQIEVAAWEEYQGRLKEKQA